MNTNGNTQYNKTGKVLSALLGVAALMTAASASAGEIVSTTANKRSDGGIESFTVSLKVTSGETNYLYRAYGETEGAEDSTNGWEAVEFVSSHTADAEIVVPVPVGWGVERPQYLRFFLSDGGTAEPIQAYASLSGTGTQWINTGVIPTDRTRIYIKFNTGAGLCAFGLTGRFYYFSPSAGYGCVGFQNKSVTGINHTTHERDNEVLFGSGAYTNDLAYTPGFSSKMTNVSGREGEIFYKNYKLCNQTEVEDKGDITTPLPLFLRKAYNGTEISKNGSCKIYFAKLYENGILIRDFTPVKIGGVAGFYERCEGKFYANAGNGTFTLGDATESFFSPTVNVVSYSPAFSADTRLRITIAAPASATVTVGADCDPASDSGYESGTVVSVTPKLGEGWSGTFDHWEGDVPSAQAHDNPLLLTMDTNKKLVPIFNTTEWTLSADKKSLSDGYWKLATVSVTSPSAEGFGTINAGKPVNATAHTRLDFSKPVYDAASNLYWVTHVTANAFQDNTHLCELRLSDHHTGFGGSSFSGCSSLTNVVPFLPETVSIIYNDAFYHCTSLRGDLKLALNGGSLEVHNRVFPMTKVTSVEAGKNVTFYPMSGTASNSFIFAACSDLTNVVLQTKNPTLWGGSLMNATSLRELHLSGVPDNWGRSLGTQTLFCNGWADGQAQVYLPRNNSHVQELMAAGTNFCRWAQLDAETWQAYYNRFGTQARRPYGKAVENTKQILPWNQWIVLTGGGLLILFH